MGKKNSKGCSWQPHSVFFLLFSMKGIGCHLIMRSSVHRMKAAFISNLGSWVDLYSVDRTDSLLDFLIWLGTR